MTRNLRSIPLFEAEMMGGPKDEENRLALAMIDTWEKQRQAIADMYAIVKVQPKYKKMRDREWKGDTSPLVVIRWLLHKLGPLAKGNRWTVDTYRQGRKTRYRFVTWKYYYNQKVARQDYVLVTDFLPYLKKRDLPLHDMIVDVMALVSRTCHIPLWDEDGDHSRALKELTGGRAMAKPDLQRATMTERQRYLYASGLAAEYLALIKRRRRKVKIGDLWQQLKAYNASSHRKESLRYWIRSGMALAEKGGNIKDHTYIPDHLTGYDKNAITPFRMYKILWSVHEHDCVASRAYGRMKKDDDKYGQYVPVMFSEARPGKVLKDIRENDFPERLSEWIHDGFRLFTGRHKDYFYHTMLEGQATPAEVMLEKIEAAEIKKMRRQ